MATASCCTDMPSPTMSELVEEVIKLYRAEETRLAERSRTCREIITQFGRVKDSRGSEEPARDQDTVADVPLKELQEMELLEQVLKKALKVRSCSVMPRDLGVGLEVKKPSDVSCTGHSKVPIKDTFKDADKRKPHHFPSCSDGRGRGPCRAAEGPVLSQPGRFKRKQPAQSSARGNVLSAKPVPAQISAADVQKRSFQTAAQSKDSYKEKMTEPPPPEEKEMKSRSSASPLKEQWTPSPLLSEWKAQRAKKNRLWNKVLTQISKPVPERAHFIERMSSTFPEGWASRQAAAGAADLDALTQLGLDLTHCHHAELRSCQPLSARVPGTDPETSAEREYESLLMLEGLEKMMVKTAERADHLKKEWERRMAGPLCPVRRRGERGVSRQACLPPMLLYSTEAELEELSLLRLRVEQLQLEIRLHQGISDTFTDHLTPQQSKPGFPEAAAVRGLYSLLGEGGARFPALVLDSGPEQTQTTKNSPAGPTSPTPDHLDPENS